MSNEQRSMLHAPSPITTQLKELKTILKVDSSIWNEVEIHRYKGHDETQLAVTEILMGDIVTH